MISASCRAFVCFVFLYNVFSNAVCVSSDQQARCKIKRQRIKRPQIVHSRTFSIFFVRITTKENLVTVTKGAMGNLGHVNEKIGTDLLHVCWELFLRVVFAAKPVTISIENNQGLHDRYHGVHDDIPLVFVLTFSFFNYPGGETNRPRPPCPLA